MENKEKRDPDPIDPMKDKLGYVKDNNNKTWNGKNFYHKMLYCFYVARPNELFYYWLVSKNSNKTFIFPGDRFKMIPNPDNDKDAMEGHEIESFWEKVWFINWNEFRNK